MGNRLFVANFDAVLSFPYTIGGTRIPAVGTASPGLAAPVPHCPLLLLMACLRASMAHGATSHPMGAALDKTGALLVADDVGNAVWRVSAKP